MPGRGLCTSGGRRGWLTRGFGLATPAVLALTPLAARAQEDGLFEKAVTTIAQHILYPIVQLLGNLLITLINILVSVAQYNGFLDAAAVDKGFTIVRDVGNLFFIIVLLIIAAGTVLNIPQYRFNRLLPRLLLMAVLVNLSKEIAGLLIDFAQVVMLTFVNAFRTAAAGNLTTAFGLSDLLKLRSTVPGAVGGYTIVGALFLALALLVVACFVVVAYVVILLVRIVALWVLVVLAPLPYVLDTFPAGKKYASEWWSKFTQYTICGPVIAFFLWLSLSVIAISSAGDAGLSSQVLQGRSVSSSEQAQVVTPADDSAIAATISEISRVDKLLSYMIAIVLLFTTLTMAQRFCGAAGSFAASMGQRARKAALFAGGVTSVGKLGLAGLRRGHRELEERAGPLAPLINPRRAWRQYQEKRQEGIKSQEARLNAGARDAVDRLPRAFGGEGMSFMRKAQVEASQQEERQKKFGNLTLKQKEEMFAQLGRHGSEADKAAFLTRAVMTGDLGTLLKSPAAARYRHTPAGGTPEVYSPETVGNLIDDWVKDGNLRTVITEAAIKQNRYEAMPAALRQSEISGQSASDLIKRSSNTFVAKGMRKAIDTTTGAVGTTGDDVMVSTRLLPDVASQLKALPYNQQTQARPDLAEAVLGRNQEVTRARITSALGHTVEEKTQLLDANQWAVMTEFAKENPIGFAALVRKKGLKDYYNVDTGDRRDVGNLLNPAVKPDDVLRGTLGWRPSATTPGAQEPAFLRDAGRERFEATRDAVAAADARGEDFFASEAFQKEQAKYLAQDEYWAQEAEAADAPDTAGLKGFAAGGSTLGVNLSRVAGGKYRTRAGLHHNDPAFVREFTQDVGRLVSEEMSALEAKTELSAREAARLQTLGEAKARLDAIAQDPSEMPELEVVNTGPGGTTKRHAIAHERYHSKVEALGPQFMDQFVAGLGQGELQRIEARMQQKTGDTTLVGNEAVEEYLVEGLANRRGTWADQSPDAIQLPTEVLERVQGAARTAGVDLDRITDSRERAADRTEARQKYDATRAKVEEYQRLVGRGDAFFASEDFRRGQAQYLSRSAYDLVGRGQLPSEEPPVAPEASARSAAGARVGRRAPGVAVTAAAGTVAGARAVGRAAEAAGSAAAAGAAFVGQKMGAGASAVAGAAAKVPGVQQAAQAGAKVAEKVAQAPDLLAEVKRVTIGNLRSWVAARQDKNAVTLRSVADGKQAAMATAMARVADHEARGEQLRKKKSDAIARYAPRKQQLDELIPQLERERDAAVRQGNGKRAADIQEQLKEADRLRRDIQKILGGVDSEVAGHERAGKPLRQQQADAITAAVEARQRAEAFEGARLPTISLGAERNARDSVANEEALARQLTTTQGNAVVQHERLDTSAASATQQYEAQRAARLQRLAPLRQRLDALKENPLIDTQAERQKVVDGILAEERAMDRERADHQKTLDDIAFSRRTEDARVRKAQAEYDAARQARVAAQDRLAEMERLAAQRLQQEAQATAGGAAATPAPVPPRPAAQPSAPPAPQQSAPRAEPPAPPPIEPRLPSAAVSGEMAVGEQASTGARAPWEAAGAELTAALQNAGHQIQTLNDQLSTLSKSLPNLERQLGTGSTAALSKPVDELRRFMREHPGARTVGDIDQRERDRHLRALTEAMQELNRHFKAPPVPPGQTPSRPAPKAPPPPPRQPIGV